MLYVGEMYTTASLTQLCMGFICFSDCNICAAVFARTMVGIWYVLHINSSGLTSTALKAISCWRGHTKASTSNALGYVRCN